MPEDRPYKPVESQKVIIGSKQAPINGLDPETSRKTVKKRLRIFIKPGDMEKTGDTRRNPRGYNALLQLVSLWHIRLRHLGLNLLKKTVKIINGIPNLDTVKEKDFVYLTYNRSKAVRRLNLKAFPDSPKILDILEGDTFKVKLRLYNKRPIGLFIIDCKLQFRWVIFLLNR